MQTETQQLPLVAHRHAWPATPFAEADLPAWLGPWAEQLDGKNQRHLWATLRAHVRALWGVECQRTPTLTGAATIEVSLPRGPEGPYVYPALPPAVQTILHRHTPNHRQECHTPLPPPVLREAALYDRRLAFLSYLRHLPTARHGVQHDEGEAFVVSRAGWYRCEVQVPSDWRHVGAVPWPRPIGIGWDYPATPGAIFESWLSWREVFLLRELAWAHVIRERILLDALSGPGADPLHTWARRIHQLVSAADRLERTPLNLAWRYAVRALAIRPLGLFHRRPLEPPAVYASAYALPPDLEPDSVVAPLADGRLEVRRPAPADSRQGRWHRPEWWAAIIAACRVAITRLALDVPREQLGAIDGDALYVLHGPLDVQDSGRIGALRCDRHWTFAKPQLAPTSLAGWRELKAGPRA